MNKKEEKGILQYQIQSPRFPDGKQINDIFCFRQFVPGFLYKQHKRLHLTPALKFIIVSVATNGDTLCPAKFKYFHNTCDEFTVLVHLFLIFTVQGISDIVIAFLEGSTIFSLFCFPLSFTSKPKPERARCRYQARRHYCHMAVCV